MRGTTVSGSLTDTCVLNTAFRIGHDGFGRHVHHCSVLICPRKNLGKGDFRIPWAIANEAYNFVGIDEEFVSVGEGSWEAIGEDPKRSTHILDRSPSRWSAHPAC